MTTLTDEQRRNLLQQIQAAQAEANRIQGLITQRQASTGMVAGANTSLNAAQLGGASGVGFEDTDTQNQISGQLQTGSEQGMSSAQTRDVSSGASPAPQVMSRSQAEFALRGAGLSGLVDAGQFAGLSPAEAQRRIQEERQKRLGQVSQLTSFAFNPEAQAATKKIIDRINFTLTDVQKSPWNSTGTQQEQIKSLLDGGAREIASLFNTPEEFQQAMMSNPEMQQTMQTFQQLGGRPEQIQQQIVPRTPQVDSLGEVTNPYANQEAERMAMEEMFPERLVAQQEIARQAQIPQEMISLYFGTEDQVGLFQMKRAQADEQRRIIEQQEKDEKIAVEKRARLAIDKNNAELQVQRAKIEENRLAAKNYMTGMLAKLGALQTTGAAPQALQTLETKYQNTTTLLENQYKFANQEIELGLDAALNDLITQRDSNILKVEQDLTKDYESVMKEILKLEQAAEKEIYRITEQFARRQRERTAKFTTDLQKEAEKYAKSFGQIAGGGIDLEALSRSLGTDVQEGQYVPKRGVLRPDGTFTKMSLTPTQENEVASAKLSGIDTIRSFIALEPKYRRAVIEEAQTGGRRFSVLSQLTQFINEVKAKEEAEREASRTTSSTALGNLSPAARALLFPTQPTQ